MYHPGPLPTTGPGRSGPQADIDDRLGYIGRYLILRDAARALPPAITAAAASTGAGPDRLLLIGR
jgi:hypothetical protein